MHVHLPPTLLLTNSQRYQNKVALGTQRYSLVHLHMAQKVREPERGFAVFPQELVFTRNIWNLYPIPAYDLSEKFWFTLEEVR